jgi:AraC-like DNA-binding protein
MQRHSHHAIQLCLPLDGTAQFQTGGDAQWVTYFGALISPDVAHAFQAPGHVVANLLFEPESMLGRSLLSKYHHQPITPLTAAQVAAFVGPLRDAYFNGADDLTLSALAQRTIAAFAGVTIERTAIDHRITEAIREIRNRIDEPIVLSKLAHQFGLSPGRFRHLFVEETGVSLRAFVLWERLNRALSLGFSGGSWTEAAHAANFADSAHLSRTSRRMFGFAPTKARHEGPEVSHRQSA